MKFDWELANRDQSSFLASEKEEEFILFSIWTEKIISSTAVAFFQGPLAGPNPLWPGCRLHAADRRHRQIRGVGTLPRGQGVRTWPAAAHAGLPALSARSVPLPPRISKKPCAAYLCRIHLFFAAEAPHLSERPRRASRAGRKGLESRKLPNRRRRYPKS